MRKRSHGYDINRRSPRHGHKYVKYRKCLSMTVLIHIEQHQIIIGSSIHEVKQHRG